MVGKVSGLFRSQTGMPVSITSNGNLFGLNLGSQYANLVGNAYTGNTNQWLNPAAFVRPADGQSARIGRNSSTPAAHHERRRELDEELRLQRKGEGYLPLPNVSTSSTILRFGASMPASAVTIRKWHLSHRRCFRAAKFLARCPHASVGSSASFLTGQRGWPGEVPYLPY